MKKNKKNSNISMIAKAARRAAREDRLGAMADGLVQTSHTFADKRKKADREACRGWRG
jgi:hypothetical protein